VLLTLTDMTDFESLLALLPPCPGLAALPLTGEPGDLHYEASGIGTFVAPPLADSANIENPRKPQIAIISAAGAVG
jgi:hypothetical protein